MIAYLRRGPNEYQPTLRVRLLAGELLPTQVEIDPARVAVLVESMQAAGFDPAHPILVMLCVVVEEPRLLGAFAVANGHHRHAAALQVFGPDHEVPCILLLPDTPEDRARRVREMQDVMRARKRGA